MGAERLKLMETGRRHGATSSLLGAQGHRLGLAGVGDTPGPQPRGRPAAQGWPPGSLASSVIPSFSRSGKNPTR